VGATFCGLIINDEDEMTRSDDSEQEVKEAQSQEESNAKEKAPAQEESRTQEKALAQEESRAQKKELTQAEANKEHWTRGYCRGNHRYAHTREVGCRLYGKELKTSQSCSACRGNLMSGHSYQGSCLNSKGHQAKPNEQGNQAEANKQGNQVKPNETGKKAKAASVAGGSALPEQWFGDARITPGLVSTSRLTS
jgi:hypothetical protein